MNVRNLRIEIVMTLVIVSTVSSLAQCPSASVSLPYRGYFHVCTDSRTLREKALNLVGLTGNQVGKGFALLAGVSRYPHFSPPNNPNLPQAAVDLRNLEKYLKENELFDEIVVLQDDDMTDANLKYFLQVYFPQRLQDSPHSRFLFAYSGHGITDGSSGYLLLSGARGMQDKENAVDLNVVHALVQHTVKAGYQVLVLINACYGGAFLVKSFGAEQVVPTLPGAHAITAGGSGERTWSDPSVGDGSLFYETLIKGLGGPADFATDGIITAPEIFAYLQKHITSFTEQKQNPQFGTLIADDSHGGSFFFLNRTKMIRAGMVAEWTPAKAIPFGPDPDPAKPKEVEITVDTSAQCEDPDDPASAGSGRAFVINHTNKTAEVLVETDTSSDLPPLYNGEKGDFKQTTTGERAVATVVLKPGEKKRLDGCATFPIGPAGSGSTDWTIQRYSLR